MVVLVHSVARSLVVRIEAVAVHCECEEGRRRECEGAREVKLVFGKGELWLEGRRTVNL